MHHRNKEALKRGLSSVCFYKNKDSINDKVICFYLVNTLGVLSFENATLSEVLSEI